MNLNTTMTVIICFCVSALTFDCHSAKQLGIEAAKSGCDVTMTANRTVIDCPQEKQ